MVKVVVLGGGIAGMSAAHELVERNFEVEVYEVKEIPGGKARSINKPHSAGPGKKPLPGEHGFRFFPSFYKHVTDTMKRIPYPTPEAPTRRAFDNLVDTVELALAQIDENIIKLPDRFPQNWHDIELIISAILQGAVADLEPGELKFFAQRIWQLFTSCQERRFGEYEKISWWDYLDASNKSPAFQSLLARGLTTSLVASRAELASTKTIGDIFLQLILGIIDPNAGSIDRILNGPTNDVWIDPWLKYLDSKGVKYHLSHRLRSINAQKDENGTMQIISATVTDLKNPEAGDITVTGDYYIAALPVEIMAGLISDDLATGDPTLANLRRLGTSTAWMNGIQFYTKDDITVAKGHVLYVDSPWALTSVSQPSFWPEFPMTNFGTGVAKGLMSVIPSNWGYFIDPNTDEVGAINSSCGLKIQKPAQICSPEEIKTEVWEQMKRSLNEDGQPLLTDDQLLDWFLDPDIIHSCCELVNDPELLEAVLNRDFPDYFKDLFLWINAQEDKVTLEQVADYLNIDQSQARLAVNALIAKGYVGPIPLPEDPEAARKCKRRFRLNPNSERLCYRSRLKEPDVHNANVNGEPLLVNLVNTWSLRPYAHTQIPNLFLASDYVRTNTDLATMEGANEAARRAVNSIIDASGVSANYCKIWKLRQPVLFSIRRWSDRLRYQKGLPWNGKVAPWYLRLLFPFIVVIDCLERQFQRFR